MKTYNGTLNRLGAYEVDGKTGQRKYAILEIGDHTLKGVCANETIVSYLDVGEELSLRVGGLWARKYIYAVGLPDGRLVKMGLKPLVGNALLKVVFLFLLLLMAELIGEASGKGAGTLMTAWVVLAVALTFWSVRAFVGYLAIR